MSKYICELEVNEVMLKRIRSAYDECECTDIKQGITAEFGWLNGSGINLLSVEEKAGEAIEDAWHKFPECLPPSSGDYLITFDATGSDPTVYMAYFADHTEDDPQHPYSWEDDYAELDYESVKAWAFVPLQPYKPE